MTNNIVSSNFKSTQKAVRTVIELGSTEIEGFQMPDGRYKLSQSSTTLAVNKPL